MKLADKIKLFYRIATSTVVSETGYQLALDRLKLGGSLGSVTKFIGLYQKEPYFNLDDILPFIENDLQSYLKGNDNFYYKINIIQEYRKYLINNKVASNIIEEIIRKIDPIIKIWKEQQYKDQLNIIIKDIDNKDRVAKFIALYQNETYFSLNDILPKITQSFSTGQDIAWDINHFLHILKENEVNENIINYIMKELSKQIIIYIDKLPNINADEYLQIEHLKQYLPNEVFKYAQKRLMLHLIRYARMEEKEETEDNDAIIPSSEFSKEWQALYIRSKTLSREWLNKLAQKFGIEFYEKAWNLYEGNHREKKVKQLLDDKTKKLNLFDINLMLRNNDTQFTKSLLLDIINRADKSGKEYMRGLIYYNPNHPDYAFILDEAMEPMDINYKKVAWPKIIRITKIKDLETKELQDKWRNLMHEFGITPQ